MFEHWHCKIKVAIISGSHFFGVVCVWPTKDANVTAKLSAVWDFFTFRSGYVWPLSAFQEWYGASSVAFPGMESGTRALPHGCCRQLMSGFKTCRELRSARRKCCLAGKDLAAPCL